MNAVLWTITTRSEINQLIHITATMILEMLVYQYYHHKPKKRPLRGRLEAKIRGIQTEISQKRYGEEENTQKYNKLSIPEAVETAK